MAAEYEALAFFLQGRPMSEEEDKTEWVGTPSLVASRRCGVLAVLQEVANSIPTEIKPREADWNEYLHGLSLPDGVDIAKGHDMKGRLFVARRSKFGSSETEVVLQRYTPDCADCDTTLVVSNRRFPSAVGCKYVRELGMVSLEYDHPPVIATEVARHMEMTLSTAQNRSEYEQLLRQMLKLNFDNSSAEDPAVESEDPAVEPDDPMSRVD